MRSKRSTRKSTASPAAGTVVLRLYIVDNAPNSLKAVANLAAICEEFLLGRFSLEIIDVLQQPLRALADGVLVTPNLLKISPGPAANVIGNLGRRRDVLRALGI
jgi:circadian clock protein KaiB